MLWEDVVVQSKLNPDDRILSFDVTHDGELTNVRIPACNNRDELIGLSANLEIGERVNLDISSREWEYESRFDKSKKSGVIYYVLGITHYI